MTRLRLPNVTMVIADTKNHQAAVNAINRSLQLIEPHSTIFFTANWDGFGPSQVHGSVVEAIGIPPITSLDDYSRFMCQELWRYITTSHVLVIQHDGFVLDASAWTDEFLEYDYIGAPWDYKDGRNVGNGGFSLRSKRLQHILATDPAIEIYGPEDEVICRLYRKYLETKHGIRFAPESLAHKFSFEMHPPKQPTFGFHNFGHRPFREPVIVKRSGAMGDVIMTEPVLERLHSDGYRVILDCPYDYMEVFNHHPYPIENVYELTMRNEDYSHYRVIDLDMSYEKKPQQLALKSYYETAGIKDGLIRNSMLFRQEPRFRLFERYIILHIDPTGMSHRNVHGVDWQEIVDYIEMTTHFKVFRVGSKDTSPAGIYLNTPVKSMLQYLVGGADYFIGLDSGVAQVAVASGVKSMIFFGSVNPAYRYADLSDIYVVQNGCPIKKDGCYHSLVSVKGTDCEVDIAQPPCITHTTESIIEHLNKFIV